MPLKKQEDVDRANVKKQLNNSQMLMLNNFKRRNKLNSRQTQLAQQQADQAKAAEDAAIAAAKVETDRENEVQQLDVQEKAAEQGMQPASPDERAYFNSYGK